MRNETTAGIDINHWMVAAVVLLMMIVAPVRAEMIDIDNQQLRELLAKGVPLIDVRRAEEWRQTGVVENSELLTFFDDKGRYDAAKWLGELSSRINTEEPVILICQVGGRTSIVGKWLGKQMATVYNVEKGIVGWMKEGNETVAP